MGGVSGGFTCVNPACDIVYSVDPGDCICGATSFVRVGERVRSAVTVDTRAPASAPAARCGRADCQQPLPAGAHACPYCGSPTPADAPQRGEDMAAEGAASVVVRQALVAADGTRIPLREGEEVVLGRHPDESAWARLAEGHPGVSRRHASVVVWRGVLHVRDLDSSNGTWVNGIRIAGVAELPVVDGIRLGLGRRFEMVVRTT